MSLLARAQISLYTAAVLLVSSTAALAQFHNDDAAPQWYHVEILLFAQPAGDLAVDETLLPIPRPRLPANVAVLRDGRTGPANLGQLAALREAAGAAPQVRLVTPGLTPDIEDLIDWSLDQSQPVPALTFDRNLTLAARRVIDVPPAAAPQVAQPAQTAQPAQRPVPAIAQQPQPLPDTELTGEGEPEPLPVPMEMALLPVPAAELLLLAEAERLAAAGVQVLVHAAWRLPMAADDPPLAVSLGSSLQGEPPLAVLAIERRRFLHAHLQAWLAAQAGDPSAGVIPVSARARMRSGETHLLDHPRVAALVRTEEFVYLGGKPAAADDASVQGE